MKLLEIVSPVFKNKEGENEQSISYVNPRYIISVDEEKDSKGVYVTAITIQGGMTRTLRDFRDMETIAGLINESEQ